MNSLLVTILNKPELICLHTVTWFQALLSNAYSFICTVKWCQLLLCNTNNSI